MWRRLSINRAINLVAETKKPLQEILERVRFDVTGC
jgi:hypothetical protein